MAGMLRRTGNKGRIKSLIDRRAVYDEKIHARRSRNAYYFRSSLACLLLALGVLLLCLWKDKFQFSPSITDPIETRADSDCPAYGCLVRPPEVLDIKEFINANFATETMAMLTQKSNHHTFNQDAAMYISPFRTTQTVVESDFLLGIFDGHGDEGHIVAQYAAREIPEVLAHKLNSINSPIEDEDSIVSQLLKDTFVEVDKLGPPNMMRGGCTASVTMRRGSKLFVANAGDSRTIVVTVQNDRVNIPFMSRKDKPHLPDELARIEQMGGHVHIPPQNPVLARVIVYSTVFREPIGLAMSRSIGDWEWGAVGVTAEPIVDVLDLQQKNMTDAFVLAASDGVWDMRRPQFFANLFANSFYREGDTAVATALDLIQRITPKNATLYRDDITLIAAKL
jgi:serine/threonine protein phosphatase PrpC